MPTSRDVAQYILEKLGEITTIKLQKLVYYCQAWCLVWTEKPLFNEKIEAWANGPVVPELYAAHKGLFSVSPTSGIGASCNLSTQDRMVVDGVLRTYGNKPAQWLVQLSHMESPWKDARASACAGPGERSDVEITHAAMAEYYSGLLH